MSLFPTITFCSNLPIFAAAAVVAASRGSIKQTVNFLQVIPCACPNALPCVAGCSSDGLVSLYMLHSTDYAAGLIVRTCRW